MLALAVLVQQCTAFRGSEAHHILVPHISGHNICSLFLDRLKYESKKSKSNHSSTMENSTGTCHSSSFLCRAICNVVCAHNEFWEVMGLCVCSPAFTCDICWLCVKALCVMVLLKYFYMCFDVQYVGTVSWHTFVLYRYVCVSREHFVMFLLYLFFTLNMVFLFRRTLCFRVSGCGLRWRHVPRQT